MDSQGKDMPAFITSCEILPPQLNSETIWLKRGPDKLIPQNTLPLLEMQICLIFFATFFFHTFLARLGIPKFTTMSIVGLVFAYSFNDTWVEGMKKLFSIQESLGLLSVFGYSLFLFYIGVKTDLSMVSKAKKSAATIGSLALAAPFLCGLAFLNLHSSKYLNKTQIKHMIVVISVITFTPFPVISSLLTDLKILNSELGRLGLSSALVGETLSTVLGTVLNVYEIVEVHGQETALMCLAAVILFLSFLWLVLRPAMFWIIRQTPEGSPVNEHYVYSILILALFSSYASNLFGFHPLFGPYMLGLVVPEGPPLGTAIIKKIDTFVNGILVPLFVTTCAMRMDLKDLLQWKEKQNGEVDYLFIETIPLLVVTFIAKFSACMIPPLVSKMPLIDAVSLSLVVNCKGIVDMATYSFLTCAMDVPKNVFALLMIFMIVNATAIPMLLRFLYDPRKKYAGYTKRNITDLRTNAELRVLACIHRPDNIPPAMNLLEAAYPTKEEPLGAYVLHLIELIGRASPVFISHQLQKKSDDPKNSLSRSLLEAFDNLQQEFPGASTVNTFTAVSPAEMMYDDICTLALNKLTTLIVLPFHRKFSSDGSSIELEDESLRELNFRVLELAPCSVGILIERAQITHTFSLETPYTVCLLFIGGKDDREAFFFTRRMTKNPNVRVTVVRLVAENSTDMAKDWDDMVDSELLNGIKMNNRLGDAHVKYIEKVVKDGPETALIVRSLVCEYDLIITGRQAEFETPQTSGLLQWSEFPELGLLGDLMASTDSPGKASVFVIQQQRTAMDI